MADIIGNNISTPVMIYGRAPNGTLQAATTDGNGNLNITGAGGGGSGTVTNIATTAPITGGPITTTGTIACATCTTSSAAITANVLAKGDGTGQGIVNSSITDNGTVVSTTEPFTTSANGAASQSALSVTGTPFTGGLGTTTFPLVYINSGTNPTFNTNGAMLSINGPSGFAGSLMEVHANGGSSLFTINSSGALNVSTTVTSGSTTSASKYLTGTNCSSSASPAVCASASAGSVAIANPATTIQVNTTAVTANSQIIIVEDSSLGTKLGVTCNATAGRTYMVTARTAATNFTITASATPAANSACLSYQIIN